MENLSSLCQPMGKSDTYMGIFYVIQGRAFVLESEIRASQLATIIRKGCI